jgi:hypothetical protein
VQLIDEHVAEEARDSESAWIRTNGRHEEVLAFELDDHSLAVAVLDELVTQARFADRSPTAVARRNARISSSTSASTCERKNARTRGSAPLNPADGGFDGVLFAHRKPRELETGDPPFAARDDRTDFGCSHVSGIEAAKSVAAFVVVHLEIAVTELYDIVGHRQVVEYA